MKKNSTDKLMQSYIKQIAQYKSYSRSEENRLAKLAQKGDKEAVNKLLTANLKFVVKIAAAYQGRGLSLAELVSEGNIGLIRAINGFDPDRGTKLISYAVHWIKQKISQAVAERSSLIRVPLGKYNLRNRIKRLEDNIYRETGSHIDAHEMSGIISKSSDVIKNAKKAHYDMYYIDEPINRNDEFTFSEFMGDDPKNNPEAFYYREKIRKELNDALESLEPREKKAIVSYYGLYNEPKKNFIQIGKDMGLSRERVRQFHNNGMSKIRQIMSEVMKKYGEYS